MKDFHNYNKLRDEASSYLTQHNKNPVHWFPYGPEALQLAKDEDKPIFLSIGYSSCHWCHVMEAESFEDQKTADLLNQNFICIKVDKEELPDLDSYYQLASQVMNGKGGWPLNAFLTPNMKPYFVGTYFPKVKIDETPSFTEIIQNLSRSYKEELDSVLKNAEQIAQALRQPPTVEHKVEFEGHYPAASSILNALKNYQDSKNGGYIGETKFPHFSFFEWAIEHMLEGMISKDFGNHIIKSVELMMMGGIYDQARGGIHRYSVNEDWSLPHFEKMLYDQAGLLKLLAKTSLIYPSPLIYDGLIQTIDYLHLEMLSDEGYFFSSQDSDSEEIEGLYFTYTKDEFIDALTQFDEELSDKLETYLEWFKITDEGNFQKKLNTIVLNPEFKNEFYTPEGWNQVRKIRQALLESRKLRVPPQTDNKGVSSWNFQTLTALLDVIQYCKVESIQQAASELFKKASEGVHKTFLFEDSLGKSRIKTSTTRSNQVPLFENYVFFAEYSFRAHEVFGDNNFLENATSTVSFIFDEFFKNNIFYTRSISFTDTEEYENIHTPIFDQAYKASLATLITQLRKWSSVIPEFKDHLENIKHTLENLTHLSLQSPLTFGETLRALVYPENAYRKVEVPLSWLKNRSFYPFFINFSNRFSLTYHQNETEAWKIFTTTQCEFQGSGLDEFSKIFQQENSELQEDNS